MKANNLSISIPNRGCDKNCPYCVSKMTGYVKSNEDLFYRNISKVFQFSQMAQVSSVSLTGKGEPMLNFDAIKIVLGTFQKFPVELQTNGIRLKNKPHFVKRLFNYGLDIVAFSFDNINNFKDYVSIIKCVNDNGMTSRVTLNVTDLLPNDHHFTDYIDLCKKHEINQFSLRNIIAPNYSAKNEHYKWIEKNTKRKLYLKLIEEFNEIKDSKLVHLLRGLPYGAKVYDVDGISFTYFDYCIQDNNNNEDIRSLIFLEDGHLYTSWNSKASRIF